jgi:hypothetical protein
MPNSRNPEELFIRLHLDRHVIVRLADDLMERGHNVLTTQQAGLDDGHVFDRNIDDKK